MQQMAYSLLCSIYLCALNDYMVVHANNCFGQNSKILLTRPWTLYVNLLCNVFLTLFTTAKPHFLAARQIRKNSSFRLIDRPNPRCVHVDYNAAIVKVYLDENDEMSKT